MKKQQQHCVEDIGTISIHRSETKRIKCTLNNGIVDCSVCSMHSNLQYMSAHNRRTRVLYYTASEMAPEKSSCVFPSFGWVLAATLCGSVLALFTSFQFSCSLSLSIIMQRASVTHHSNRVPTTQQKRHSTNVATRTQ